MGDHQQRPVGGRRGEGVAQQPPRCGRPGWPSARRAAAARDGPAATGRSPAVAARRRTAARPRRRPGRRGPRGDRRTTSVSPTSASTAQQSASVASGPGEQQVVPDRAGQHRRVLLDVAEPGPQRRPRQLADVGPRPAGSTPPSSRVEALDQRQDRRLAGAGRSDQRDPAARGTVKGRRGAPPAVGVAEADVVELEQRDGVRPAGTPPDGRRAAPIGLVGCSGGQRQDLLDPGQRAEGGLQLASRPGSPGPAA